MAANGRSAVGLLDALYEINRISRDYNTTGVLLGACYTGSDTVTMEVCIEGGAIRWCASYASSANWLEGTLIDCAILSAMSELEDEDYGDSATLTSTLADALAPFDGRFAIGCDENDEPVVLADLLRAVIRPAARGTNGAT